MEKPAPYQDLSGQAGLNPRHALDILEVRARQAQSELAQAADAGDAVLQYLAQHGAPATRAAVAASMQGAVLFGTDARVPNRPRIRLSAIRGDRR